ncbi:hypothetical protein LSTR_LSTR001503 [Laodelphax striatellus]|uniref:Uncharacterized protein n=1 Tax=Laodelphax striatellus TaxID=195883 RepID=A0A482XB60_LAOST|nr:hypothetical protein LSTR_LSTR001503 [Laodelphax striatellus]
MLAIDIDFFTDDILLIFIFLAQNAIQNIPDNRVPQIAIYQPITAMLSLIRSVLLTQGIIKIKEGSRNASLD